MTEGGGQLATKGVVVVAVGAAIALVLLAMLIVASPNRRPGDTADLDGSAWDVTVVEEQSISDVVLDVEADRDAGRFTTNCSEIAFTFGRDTDGDDFSFGDITYEDHGCTSNDAQRDLALRSAIERVGGWRAMDAAHIEFRDDAGRTLIEAVAAP